MTVKKWVIITVIAGFSIAASELIAFGLARAFNLTDLKFFFTVGFLQPLVASPPAALAYFVLRDWIDDNRRDLEKGNQDLEQALKNVKSLARQLPVCTSCKKVRTDKGYWNKLESYIADHSSALFTHGICPACQKKLMEDGAEDQGNISGG